MRLDNVTPSASNEVRSVSRRKRMKKPCVYILKCSDNSYYTGVTSNLEKRFLEHQSGFHPGSYTYSRRPVELKYSQDFTTMLEAIATEKQIKSWSRKKKKALISGNIPELKQAAKKTFTIHPHEEGDTRTD